MSKKIIELDELKRIMAVQKEHKERNEEITAVRRNSADDSKCRSSLGRKLSELETDTAQKI